MLVYTHILFTIHINVKQRDAMHCCVTVVHTCSTATSLVALHCLENSCVMSQQFASECGVCQVLTYCFFGMVAPINVLVFTQ